jgi:hypothetical protein
MLYQSTNVGRLILEYLAQEKTASVASQNAYDLAEAKKISDGLTKVASYEYTPGVYGNVQEIMKIAARCIQSLCTALESDKQRIGTLEKTAEVRAILDDMVNFGFVGNEGVGEKVAELLKKSEKDLEIIKEAMKLSVKGKEGGNMFFELEKDAGLGSSTSEKKGIFDDVIGDN